MSKLKSLRIEKKLTQQQVADLMGISLRSYKSYENDEEKIGKVNRYSEKQAENFPAGMGRIETETGWNFKILRNCEIH